MALAGGLVIRIDGGVSQRNVDVEGQAAALIISVGGSEQGDRHFVFNEHEGPLHAGGVATPLAQVKLVPSTFGWAEADQWRPSSDWNCASPPLTPVKVPTTSRATA